MEVMAREPRANAAFLRLPRSGNHHDLGLFGVGAQPPRPRGSLGLYHLAWQVDTIEELEEARLTLANLDAYTGESSHGATKSVYGEDPDGNEFEVMWMLPKAAGATSRARTGRASGPARRGTPLGRRPHRPPSWSRWRRDDRRESFAPPVVATSAARTRPHLSSSSCTGAARTSSDILGLAGHLPSGPSYAAVRAPIVEGGGFAWFANRGIGRPVAESLPATPWTGSAAGWTTSPRPAGRCCWSASAAGLRSPAVWCWTTRRATSAPRSCYGTLPFDAGLATDAGRLANLPVFVAQGDGDHVIPRELLDRTWDYLLAESGAPTVAQRQPGGHQLTADTVHELGDWIAHRLGFVGRHAAAPAGPLPTPVAHACRRPAPRATRPEARGELDDPAAATDPERAPGPPGAAVRGHPAAARCGRGPIHISVPGARGFALRGGLR